MAEPTDPLTRAWRDVINQLRSLPTIPGQTEFARAIIAPLQRQAELFEETLQRQLRFERDLAGRVLEPVTIVFDALGQTSSALRQQAEAMQAASTALKQASEVLELQASMIDRTMSTIRDPTAFLRNAARGRDDTSDE